MGLPGESIRQLDELKRVCAIDGGSGLMAKALSEAFHLVIQRALPLPVGSSDRVTRLRHFRAAVSFGKCPRARTVRR